MLTYEIHSKLAKQPPEVYQLSLALQAPILEMMLRGVKVNQQAVAELLEVKKAEMARLEASLDYIGERTLAQPQKAKKGEPAHWLNARSSVQLQAFFYSWLGLPRVAKHEAGKVSYPMDEETLEKLCEHLLARPVARLVLAIRGVAKEIERLTSPLSADGRARCSFKLAGTTTGRLSSSKFTDGTGSNLQTVTSDLRHIYEADPGWKMCSIDLEQAESRMVGWIIGTLFDDWVYLDYAEKKDIHTHMTRLVWPELAWTGDDNKDKKIAKEVFRGGLSRRDMMKRVGHGSNYHGVAKNLAARVFLPVPKVVEAQRLYFQQFPGIPKWHKYVIEEIRAERPIITPFGFSRRFYGRPDDAATHREAIAFAPQSAVAHYTNYGIYRCWSHFRHRIRPLLQVHDAFIFLYRPEEEDEIIPKALELMEIPLRCPVREMKIPGEASVGYNWGYRVDNRDGTATNPRGLVKWSR